MDFGIWPADGLEIRQEGPSSRLVGSFPYGSDATIASRGARRKERFAPGAFRFSVSGPGSSRPIDLLFGHDYSKPLATRRAGGAGPVADGVQAGPRSLKLTETEDALLFEAALPAEAARPTWLTDAILAVQAGLVRGISPGFNVPPANVVPNAEELIPEPGNPNVLIRLVRHAVLFELSLVTRPAYQESAVDLDHRAWEQVIEDRGEPIDVPVRIKPHGPLGQTDETGPENDSLELIRWL